MLGAHKTKQSTTAAPEVPCSTDNHALEMSSPYAQGSSVPPNIIGFPVSKLTKTYCGAGSGSREKSDGGAPTLRRRFVAAAACCLPTLACRQRWRRPC